MGGTIARRASLGLAALAALAALAFAGSDDAHPPSTTRRFETSDHLVGIDLPAEWNVASMPSDHAVLSLRVSTTAANPTFDIDVFHMAGFLDPRCQAYSERELEVERFDGAKRGEVSLDPVPNLVMTVPESRTSVLRAWIYRVIDRNGFTITVRCDPAAWPAVKDACFDAVKSLTSAIPEWPAPPEGYARSERDGYEYLVQPGVMDADVVALHAAILEFEKKYAKTHGPVPKPREDRPVVVVSVDKAASCAAAGVAANHEDEIFASAFHGRLYAVPLRKDDVQEHAHLAAASTEILHAQCYGQLASTWLCSGEKRLAFAEASLGRPLPALPEGFAAESLPKVVAPFDDLVHRPAGDAVKQATAYVALFRAGPKPWRDAFAAFLKDLAATGDWDAAERKDLFCLDQQKLRAAAQAWVNEKRPPKGK